MANNKLDFLMNLTNVRNSALGRAIGFDSSYISRMRHGKRSFSRKPPFLNLISSYFAKSISFDYQKKILADTICPGSPWPDDLSSSEQLISRWLDDDSDSFSLPDLLAAGSDGISSGTGFSVPALKPDEAASGLIPQSDVRLYFGNSGKRRAVKAFLEQLLTLKRPGQLLLCSDESMNWLDEDDDYIYQGIRLFLALFAKGWRMKMIHCINRSSSEMMLVVHKWIPLYMSGAIEPYYYPQLRDGIYHRTLFIARDHMAVCSTSIGNRTEEALNLLLTDSKAVSALEDEFSEYFRRCRPLANIYNAANAGKFRKAADLHSRCMENTIMTGPVPSIMTLPPDAAGSVGARAGSTFINYYKESYSTFLGCLSSGKQVIEILNLPDAASFNAGEGPVLPLSDMYGLPDVRYTVNEFREHLKNTVLLMNTYENYRVYLSPEIAQNAMISVKEDTGCLVMSAAAPTAAFSVSEPRMAAAFWSYFDSVISTGCNRSRCISMLEEYIGRL